MPKISEVLKNLEKNIQYQEQQIIEIYKRKSEELELSLKNEWQEMQNRIEKNIQNQNHELLQTLTEKLENIDWELEHCRIMKPLKWAIGGIIAGIILTLTIIHFITNTTTMAWGGTNYTSKVWYLKWDKPKK